MAAALFLGSIADRDEEPGRSPTVPGSTTRVADRPVSSTAMVTTASPHVTTTFVPTLPPIGQPAPPPTIERSAPLLPSAVEQPAAPQAAVPAPRPECDPNYSGCVPIASDVDCAGGSGNGPAYVDGPISVIGSDIYDLDRDRDGIACE
ncbi:hypothetical protein [Nocardia sp. IFM 10818]